VEKLETLSEVGTTSDRVSCKTAKVVRILVMFESIDHTESIKLYKWRIFIYHAYSPAASTNNEGLYLLMVHHCTSE
jgi:hypothetical protein